MVFYVEGRFCSLDDVSHVPCLVVLSSSLLAPLSLSLSPSLLSLYLSCIVPVIISCEIFWLLFSLYFVGHHIPTKRVIHASNIPSTSTCSPISDHFMKIMYNVIQIKVFALSICDHKRSTGFISCTLKSLIELFWWWLFNSCSNNKKSHIHEYEKENKHVQKWVPFALCHLRIPHRVDIIILTSSQRGFAVCNALSLLRSSS